MFATVRLCTEFRPLPTARPSFRPPPCYPRSMIERACTDIYTAARLDIEGRPSLGAVVAATMGLWPGYSGTIRRRACTRRVGENWQPIARADIDAHYARWLWSRELARWWLSRYAHTAGSPSVVDRLGAAVLTPRDLFLSYVDNTGGDVPALAELFAVPQGLILLRLGETTGRAVALVRPGGVCVLRGARNGRQHLRRVVLTDDDRIGMIAG
jgi:hypothetical protein